MDRVSALPPMSVVWAKYQGCAYWPSQVVAADAAELRVNNAVLPPSGSSDNSAHNVMVRRAEEWLSTNRNQAIVEAYLLEIDAMADWTVGQASFIRSHTRDCVEDVRMCVLKP